MPTYEYRCDACGHRFERLQKFSDDPVRTCPDCGEEAVERLISAGAGLLFKGSGFYETDYKKKSSRAGPGSEEKAKEGKDDGSGGSGGDGSPPADAGDAPPAGERGDGG